jgi:serine/threonine-protein kinase
VHEQRLGSRYLLADRLGGGGMGEVFLAHTTDGNGEQLAVKLLRPELAEDPDLVSRFLQESRLLRSVRHPNVVRVLDLVAEGDRFGIVMEYVPDGDLRHTIPLPCPISLALELLAQVADGLAAIHAQGITHRDLKPENVLVQKLQDGSLQARVTDFGVSHRSDSLSSRHNGIVGTAGYLSPESAKGLRAGPEGDIYAVGVMLYEMCTGQRPFIAENALAVIRAHVESPVPRPPAMADPLWELVSQLLAKEPGRRPEAAAVALKLRALAGSQEITTLPVATLPRTSAADLTLLRVPNPAIPAGVDPDASTLLRAGSARAPQAPSQAPVGERRSRRAVAASSTTASTTASTTGTSATATATPPALQTAGGAGAAEAGVAADAEETTVDLPGAGAAGRSGRGSRNRSRRALRRSDGPRRDRRLPIAVAVAVLVLLLAIVLVVLLRPGGAGSGSGTTVATGTTSPTTDASTPAASAVTDTRPSATTVTVTASPTTTATPSTTASASTSTSSTSTSAFASPAVPALTLDPPASSLQISDGRVALAVNGVDPGVGTVSSILIIYNGGSQPIGPINGVAGPYRTTVTGLQNGKAYSFTAKVCNSYGECSTSKVAQFTPFTYPTLNQLSVSEASGIRATVVIPAISRNGNPHSWSCRITVDTLPHDLQAPNQEPVSAGGGVVSWDPLALHTYNAQETCSDGTTTINGPVLTFRTG